MDISTIISNALGISLQPQEEGLYYFKIDDESGGPASFCIQYNHAEQIVIICAEFEAGIDLGSVNSKALLGLLQDAAEPMRSGFGVGILPDSGALTVYRIVSPNLFNEELLASTLPLMFEQLLAYEGLLSNDELG